MSQVKLIGIDVTLNGIMNAHHNFKKRILGEFLTLIDAAIPQGQQNKCFKDLVTNAIYTGNAGDGNTHETKNVIAWLKWLNDNQGDSKSSEPFLYQHFTTLKLDEYKESNEERLSK